MGEPAYPMSKPPPPGTVIAAAILLGVKVVLGIWVALILFSATRLHHRRFLGAVVRRHHPGLGVLLLVFVAVTVAVIIGLVTLSAWARIAAFVLEGVTIVAALIEIASRPGVSLFSVVLSLIVIGLLVTRPSSEAFTKRTQGPA